MPAGGLVIPGLLPAGRRGEPFLVMARYAICRQLRSFYDKCIIADATTAGGGPFKVHIRPVADEFFPKACHETHSENVLSDRQQTATR